MKSGYLIPADPQGQVIRVSPTLADTRRSNAESRKKRRRARKGEDEDPFADRKERRRGTPPLATKRKPRREVTPEVVVPRKRRKTSASRKPRTNLNATERIDKKKSVGRGCKAGTKKTNTATTKKKLVDNLNLRPFTYILPIILCGKQRDVVVVARVT